MVSFWDRVGANLSTLGRGIYNAVDENLAFGWLPGGVSNPRQVEQAQKITNRTRSGYYTVPEHVRHGPNNRVGTTVSGGTVPGNTGPTGGTPGPVGGGNFGGSGFSFTPPAFQMPEINIPAFSTPKAPKVKRIGINKLRSLVKTDPTFIEEMAALREGKESNLLALNAEIALQNTRQVEDARRLAEDSSSALRSVLGQTNAGNSGMGMEAIRARMRAEAMAQRAESDLERQYADMFAGLNLEKSNVKNNFQRNKATAKQNAINRYLSSRVTPTEVVY